MKTISTISALTVTLSVATLGSGGGWTWAALAFGLAGTIALIVSCGHLGCFCDVEREERLAQVVLIEGRAGPAQGRAQPAERSLEARARAR